MGKSIRNSNIELLRIFSMFLIVAFHIYKHIDISDLSTPGKVITSAIGSWGILGVYLFIIISAWFTADKKFRISHIISVLVQVASYIIGFWLLFLCMDIFKGADIGSTVIKYISYIGDIIKTLCSCSVYWFVSSYIIMNLFAPMINYCIENLNNEQLKKILIIMSVPAVFSQINTGLINDSFNFIYIYFIVSFIKHKHIDIVNKIKLSYVVFAVLMFIIPYLTICYFGNTENPVINIIITVLKSTIANKRRNSLMMAFIALIIFLYTIQRKEHHNKFINYTANTMFGVYLYHVFCVQPFCGNTISEQIKSIFTKYLLFNIHSGYFIHQYLFLVLFIMISGMIIEIIRQQLVQKPVMKLLNKNFNKSFEKIDNFINNRKKPADG